MFNRPTTNSSSNIFGHCSDFFRHYFGFKSLTGRVFWLVLVAVVWVLLTLQIGGHIYNSNAAAIDNRQTVIWNSYQQKVASDKNVDQLITSGRKALAQKDYVAAALNFKQASDLDKQFRDSAIGWSYATIAAVANGDWPVSKLDDAKTGITRAKSLDPTNATVKQLQSALDEIEKK